MCHSDRRIYRSFVRFRAAPRVLLLGGPQTITLKLTGGGKSLIAYLNPVSVAYLLPIEPHSTWIGFCCLTTLDALNTSPLPIGIDVAQIIKRLLDAVSNPHLTLELMNRRTPDNIEKITPNEVFVFGSNLSGRHGKGAAKQALTWGAKWGQAEGLQGKTYGIPTKDASIRRTLTVEEIKPFVDRFIKFAEENPKLIFMVTEIGCGLAGHDPKNIAPLFQEAVNLTNVYLPHRFLRKLTPM